MGVKDWSDLKLKVAFTLTLIVLFLLLIGSIGGLVYLIRLI